MPFLGRTPTQLVDPEVDINGGAIDGVTIGATSASPATVTTFTSTGIDDNATSTALTVHSNENIGIGTTTDSYRLHVYHATNDAPLLIDTGSSNGAHIRFGSSGTIKHYIGSGGGISLGDHEDLTIRAFDNILVATGNSSTERLRIDSSGNVGIGTTSPNYKLDVVGAIRAENSSGSTIIANRTSNSGSVELQYNGTQTAQFSAISGGGVTTYTGATPTERMRIDSSGNLLVGTTNVANSATVPGHYILPSGLHTSTRDGGAIRILNRLTSDGDLMIFRKDNVGVGVIGTQNWGIGTTSPAGPLHINSASDTYFYIGTTNVTADARIQFRNSAGTDAGGLWYATNGNNMLFRTNSAERMRINSSGQVAIGTTSPNSYANYRVLTLRGTNGAEIDFENSSGTVIGAIYNNATSLVIASDFSNTVANSNIVFTCDSAERMRIDSARLLVNKTSTAFGTAGVEASASNGLWSTRSSLPPLALNRLTSDGSIVDFYKDGTTVGSITARNGSLCLDLGYGRAGISGTTGYDAILPGDGNGQIENGTIDLGIASYRWKDIYLSGGAYLGGTGASNHLDDYEEGTWSPTITGSSGASGQTYSTQSGHYRKIGNVVHITYDVILTNAGTLSGTYVVLGNLPFNTVGSNIGGGLVVTYSTGWGTNLLEPILAYIGGGTAYLMEGGSTGGNDYVLVSNNFHTNSSRLIGFGVLITS